MRVLSAHAMAPALLVCFCGVASSAPASEPDVSHQIRRVETEMPAVSKNGRTLKLSLQTWMDSLRVPGVSIAVIDDYQIVWAKGYGVMSADATDAPVGAEAIFQAASISKPLAALAVLRQAELGEFDLDADINDYLNSWQLPPPNVPNAKRVTMRTLLAHTAGITPGGFAGYARGATLPTIEQILEGEPPASNRPARMSSTPDSAVMYSGLGYIILQLALTDHLGRSFEDILQGSVFDPLDMDDSTFEQELPDAIAARAVSGHRNSGESIPGGWRVYPELAAAGLWTTASDLAKLAIEVAKSSLGSSNRILSREMTRQMLTQYRDQMGLGFVIRPGDTHGFFAHSGGNLGYRCHFEMLAGTGQGVVIMTNSDAGGLLIPLLTRSVAQAYAWPPPEPRAVSEALADAIFAQIENQSDGETPERRKIEVDESVLGKYVGRYELAPGLEFEVTLWEGGLHVRLGDQPRFPVFAESESEFFFEVVDAQITFVTDAAGRTVALVLHQGGRDQEAKKIE